MEVNDNTIYPFRPDPQKTSVVTDFLYQRWQTVLFHPSFIDLKRCTKHELKVPYCKDRRKEAEPRVAQNAPPALRLFSPNHCQQVPSKDKSCKAIITLTFELRAKA